MPAVASEPTPYPPWALFPFKDLLTTTHPTESGSRAADFPEWEAYCSNSVAHRSMADGRARPTSGRGYRRCAEAHPIPGAPHRKRWALSVHPTTEIVGKRLESGTCKQVFGPDPVDIPSAVALNREPRDSLIPKDESARWLPNVMEALPKSVRNRSLTVVCVRVPVARHFGVTAPLTFMGFLTSKSARGALPLGPPPFPAACNPTMHAPCHPPFDG